MAKLDVAKSRTTQKRVTVQYCTTRIQYGGMIFVRALLRTRTASDVRTSTSVTVRCDRTQRHRDRDGRLYCTRTSMEVQYEGPGTVQ